MKWLTFKVQRSPGFRLNLIDILFIGALVAVAIWIRSLLPYSCWWLIPLYTGWTFFLFCNVFRIGNRLETFWYIPFTVLCILLLSIEAGESLWWLAFIGLEGLKLVLILFRVFRGPYVGIGYRKLNKLTNTI